MIWELLDTLVKGGTALFSGISGNQAREEAGKQALDLAKIQRQDALSAQRQQQDLGYQNLGLQKKSFAFQQSEARKAREERANAQRQKNMDRVLGLLGNNVALKNNIIDMWSKTGLIKR